MSGLLPSFVSAAQLEVRIGSTVLAFCQNLAWTDDMTTTPVGGIGAYSFHSLEPVAYIGRGSMTVTHYSKAVMDVLKDIPNALPENLRSTATQAKRDGNSLMTAEFFNPVQLLISRTFDIKIYERSLTRNVGAASAPDTFAADTSRLIHTLKDCRMTNLSLTFTPGTLINQVVSFMCLSVIDHTAEDSFKYSTPQLA